MSSDEEASEDGWDLKMEAMLSAQDHSLVAAVNRRDATAVQRALRDGADVNCSCGYYNDETPLMKAVYSGNEKIVRILLEAGAGARGNNSLNCTPMQIACEEGHLSIVEMLLSYDNGLLEIQDKKGQTPLFAAVYWGHIDLVRFLIDRGANVHAAPSCMAFSDAGSLEAVGGRTAPMFTCSEGDLAMVRLLLAAGVDVKARDESQKTALHDAATSLSRDMVRELILQHNANIFAVDKDGNTPFDGIPL